MSAVHADHGRMFPRDIFEVAANPGSWLVTVEVDTIGVVQDMRITSDEARSLAAALLAAADASEATA